MIDKFLLLKLIPAKSGKYYAVGLFWNDKFGWQGRYNRQTNSESNYLIEIDAAKHDALKAKLNGPVALILDAKVNGINEFRQPTYELIVK